MTGLKNKLYTPELIGSGQVGKCAHCLKLPTQDGHDGCLGTLPDYIVMNACCGHGDNTQAYIQFWDKSVIRGQVAIILIQKLKEE